ncbi:MAG: two-component regulator propeller domain-containing protein, partial [Bacteroidota bacterium]
MLSALGLLAQSSVQLTSGQAKIENGYFLTVEDGLPSNKINAITETKDGFIWLGTTKGLARYDGSEVKTFRNHPEDPNSIYDNRITVLEADTNHLFIGTFLGFSIMDLETEQFRNFQFDNFAPTDTLNKKLLTRVTSIEKARNGEVWLGTYSSGVFRYLPERDSFICYHYPLELVRPSFPAPNDIDHVLAVRQDRFNDHLFWVGTTAGLLQINTQNNEMQWYLNPKKEGADFMNQNAIRSIYQHQDEKLYISTWFAQILVFDPQKAQFSRLPIHNNLAEDRGAANRFLNVPISSILPKNQDEIWIESLEGLMTYHIPSKK